ncbi:MAG: hypothetical protein GC164_10875 [Phycisphaera sp.]|nr:hypothetical protein [Phycisphaera sp.]
MMDINTPGYDPSGEASKFRGSVLIAAMKIYNASCGCQNDYDKFMGRIWSDYQKAGKPRSKNRWIRERLKDEFRSVDQPPVWVGAEPNWAFHNGQPMVFIHQTPLIPKNETTESMLGYGDVIYLFGARVLYNDGSYRVVYKLIEESPDIPGATGVQSNPVWIGKPPSGINVAGSG